MSKTLSRPMFRRGGKVDSRGTGITSGLIPKRGLVDEPGGYAGKKSTIDYNVMGIEQPETETINAGGGVGFERSPFKKYIENPVQYLSNTAISPIGNTISNLVNYSKLLFGGEPTADYFSPIYGQQTYDQYKSINKDEKGPTILEKIAPTYTTTDVPNVEIKEDVNVSMDPKPEPTVKDTNQEVIKVDDVNSLEEEISSQADMYENLLRSDKKDDIFKALTASSKFLLDEDYGGAIDAAGKELDRSDTKQKAKELAIKEYLDGKDEGEIGKTIKAIQRLDPDLSSQDILSRLFDKTAPSQPIENVRAGILQDFEPDTDHEAIYKTGYTEFYAQSTKYPNLQLVRYESVQPGKPEKGFKQPKLVPGAVNFDPQTKKYIVFDGTNTIEYTNPEEAFNSLK